MKELTALQAIRRPQIIEATHKVIAEVGFQNLSLDLVAREAGMSKGGLIHHFPTKHELIKAAIAEFYDRIFERGRETRDRFQDPLEQILSFTWIYDMEDPDVHDGYRLLFSFTTLASQDEGYRRQFQDWVASWVALLKQPVERGMRLGLFKVKEPEETARTISAIYQGIATRWYLDPENHTTEWAVRSVKRAVSLLLTCEGKPEPTLGEEVQ